MNGNSAYCCIRYVPGMYVRVHIVSYLVRVLRVGFRVKSYRSITICEWYFDTIISYRNYFCNSITITINVNSITIRQNDEKRKRACLLGARGHSERQTAGEPKHRTILITHRCVRSSTAGPKSSDDGIFDTRIIQAHPLVHCDDRKRQHPQDGGGGLWDVSCASASIIHSYRYRLSKCSCFGSVTIIIAYRFFLRLLSHRNLSRVNRLYVISIHRELLPCTQAVSNSSSLDNNNSYAYAERGPPSPGSGALFFPRFFRP